MSDREPGYYWLRIDEEDDPEPGLMIHIDEKGTELWTMALTEGAYAEDQVFWVGDAIDMQEIANLKAEVVKLKLALSSLPELTDAMARAMYDAKDLWPNHRCDNQRELAWSFAKPRWDAAWKARS